MDLVALEPPWSVANVLDRLAPRTDAAVAGTARARLHALALHLPAALTRVIYLESWVGQLRPRLDLIVKIDPRERDALAELAHSTLGPELRAQPGWANAARFAREWAAPGSLLHDGLRAVWLEFDLDPILAPDEALRSPRVFVDFTREAQCRASVEERLELATEVICALSGSPAPGTRAEPIDSGPPHKGDRNLLAARAPLAETLAALRACLEQLPGGATLAYLGVFARDGEPPIVRACMVGLGGNLAPYLEAVRWPGDVDALARRLLGPLARAQGEGVDPVGVLHLDLAPGVGPRIGLEYTFPRSGRSGGMRSADAFLRQLVERGWCTSRNRESLRSWPMRWVELMPHDVWHSRVARQIAHVKITYAPGEPVVAKAYLRAAFDLLTGGTLLRGGLRLRFGSADSPGAAARSNGALAPSDGGTPPSPAAGSDDAAPQSLERPEVRSRAPGGTAVALAGRELTGETGMPRSTAHTEHTAHKEALEQILTRAAVDIEFRKALLVHPRKAILDGLGVRIPAKFRVKFIEREKDVDALIVLPDLQRHDCELDDGDLDGVSGGADLDPSENW